MIYQITSAFSDKFIPVTRCEIAVMVQKLQHILFGITGWTVLHKGQSLNVFNMLSLLVNTHLKALDPIVMHSQKDFRRNAGTRFFNALLEMVSVSYFLCIYELL